MKRNNKEIINEIKVLVEELEHNMQSGSINLKSGYTDKETKLEKKGCMGLIISLIEKGFLDNLKSVEQVREKLKQDGDPYTKELVSMNLLRLTKSPKNLLRRIKEKDKLMYIKRK